MTEYGCQMYSVRDSAQKDLKEALCRVAELGFTSVEFAGFFGHSAETVRAWLEEYGLTPFGTHTSGELLEPEKIGETIAYHKALGCKRLIVPGLSWGTEEKMAHNLALLKNAGKALAENGIVLGYHNHSKEFYETPYGRTAVKEILSETDTQLEVDVFWLYNAGLDPVEFLEAHRDRVFAIHLKDGLPVPAENRNYARTNDGETGLALGEGVVPVRAVREWAIRNGVGMVVESEGLQPTGLMEVGRCMQYLRSLE